jgi:hypothetical protein
MSVYEIVVEGEGEAWERVLAEQEAAVAERAIRGTEAALRTEPFGEHLAASLRDGTHQLAFAPRRLTRAILAAVAAEDGLAIERVREVTGGHFDFSVEAFAQAAAAEIRAILAAPPPGVEVNRYRDEEEGDPDGSGPGGVALHAPLHCDAYRARGRVQGALPGVVEMRLRLHSLPFVYEEPIELAAHPVDPSALVDG